MCCEVLPFIYVRHFVELASREYGDTSSKHLHQLPRTDQWKEQPPLPLLQHIQLKAKWIPWLKNNPDHDHIIYFVPISLFLSQFGSLFRTMTPVLYSDSPTLTDSLQRISLAKWFVHVLCGSFLLSVQLAATNQWNICLMPTYYIFCTTYSLSHHKQFTSSQLLNSCAVNTDLQPFYRKRWTQMEGWGKEGWRLNRGGWKKLISYWQLLGWKWDPWGNIDGGNREWEREREKKGSSGGGVNEWTDNVRVTEEEGKYRAQ